jgi:hypothetical protein
MASRVTFPVRSLKPRVIVETGVASGLSSAHILRALAANGTGTLHSIDLPNGLCPTRVGSLGVTRKQKKL